MANQGECNAVGIRFRSLLERPQGLFAYGIYDAMSAHLAELAGHECVYAGGYAAAARNLLPDMGLLGMAEILEHVKWIDRAVSVPVIADIDEGYGGVHNVIRTVSEFLSLAHVAGLHLEDQRVPKRCGHISGKEVLPLEEFAGKLKAAIDERNRVAPAKVIIARTDAFSAAGGKKDEQLGGDIKEAVRRGIAYADLGADMVWCEFPAPDALSAEAFAEGVKKRHPSLPLAFNVSPSFSREAWQASSLDEKTLNAMGYKFRFSTYPAILAAMHAVWNSANEFLMEGTHGLRLLQLRIAASKTESVKKIVGVDKYLLKEQAYDPKARGRQEDSEGFKV